MRAKEVFAAALKALNLTQAQVARMANMPEQSIGQKINVRESIRANEFFDLLDTIGVEAVFFIKETGEVLMKEPQHGRRLVGMSDRVIYDTNEGTLVASSFYADGENEYGPDGKAQELYIDKQGRYFTAEYFSEGPVKGRIRATPADMASAFISKFGVTNEEVPV